MNDVEMTLDSAFVQVSPPTYQGPYQISVTGTETLATGGKVMNQDLTVTGGGRNYLTDFAEGNVTELTADNCAAASVGVNAFYSCQNLASVSLPACTSVGGNAFCNCPNLASVRLPACTSVGNGAFQNCQSLASVSLPACTSVDGNAFYNCPNLASVSLPACTSVGGNAFQNCSKLQAVWVADSALASLLSDYRKYYLPLSMRGSVDESTQFEFPILSVQSLAMRGSAVAVNTAIVGHLMDTHPTDAPTITADNGCTVSGTTVTIPDSVTAGTIITITATAGGHNSTATVSVLAPDPVATVSAVGDYWFELDSVDPDGHYVYRSTNYNVNNSVAKAKVTISGNGTYTIHVKNSGEEDCDYFEASALDATDIVRDGSTNVLKANGVMTDFTSTHDYVVSDGGTHSFIVCFSKDGFVAKGLDRAFFYVTKA